MALTKLNFTGRNIDNPAILSQGGVETGYSSGGSNYRVHTWEGGQTSIFSLNAQTVVDFLIVGGGGGATGACDHSCSTGGAGAGGMVVGTSQTLKPGNYTVNVGAGGVAVTSQTADGNPGGDSSIVGTGINFVGKGGAGSPKYDNAGLTGGSGAGGSESNKAAGASTQDTYSGTTNVTGYGNAGGAGGQYSNPNGQGSGGGGGAGGAGQAATAGRAGGIGLANNFRTGSNITYAVGGAGNEGAVNSVGGDHIGGSNNTLNRGNGASGTSASSPSGNSNSAAGGGGIVVIRYAV